MAGRRHPRVGDCQDGDDSRKVQGGVVDRRDGNENEFGGSGARFRRPRRRRGVSGDGLVQMTIQTGAHDTRGEGGFRFRILGLGLGLEKSEQRKRTRPEESDLPAEKRKCFHG